MVFCAFHLVYFWDSSVLCVSVIYSFLLLDNILLYDYTTISLSIHQMMDVSVVTSFWLLWIQTAAVNIGTLAPHIPAGTNLLSDYRFACLVLIFLKNGLIVFLLGFESSLYTMDASPLSVMCFANIFFHFVTSLFIYLTVPFEDWKFDEIQFTNLLG